MIKTKVSLKSFYIFNSSLCEKEGEEDKKILFFYPEIETNEKLKDVGLVEAIVKFSAQFSLEKNEDVLTMKTQKTLKLFFECEKDFWMVMTLKVPFERKWKDNKEYIEYYSDDVNDAVYKKVIHRAYQQFKTFCNTFDQNMSGSNEIERIECLKTKLNQFYMKYLVVLNLHHADIIDLIQCLQYRPITHLIFFRIVNFMNLISSIKSLCIKKCIFIHNINDIIYSSLSPTDLCIVSEYLNEILFPKFLQRRNSQSVDSDRSDGSFINEHEEENLQDSPKIFLESQRGVLEQYRLVVYNVLDLTFVMLVDDKEAILGDEFSNEIKYSVGPQLVVMSKEIQESLQLQQQNTQGSTSKSQSNECDPLQEKYIYFNHKNFRFHACIYDNASGQKENRKTQIPSSVMNLLCDLYSKDIEDSNDNALINSEKEMILKTYNDFWICSKHYNNRSLYLIFHKSSTLIDIAEDSQRLLSEIVKNVYFTNQY